MSSDHGNTADYGDHWRLRADMDGNDPNLLGEDEYGDLWVPVTLAKGLVEPTILTVAAYPLALLAALPSPMPSRDDRVCPYWQLYRRWRVVRTRIEIGPSRGRAGVIFHVDPDAVDPVAKAAAAEVIGRAAAQLAADTGMAFDAARDLLLVEAVLAMEDRVAYEREAARRGVLAL